MLQSLLSTKIFIILVKSDQQLLLSKGKLDGSHSKGLTDDGVGHQLQGAEATALNDCYPKIKIPEVFPSNILDLTSQVLLNMTGKLR